jgi:hypothetical protein
LSLEASAKKESFERKWVGLLFKFVFLIAANRFMFMLFLCFLEKYSI